MDCVPTELNLNLRPNFFPKNITDFLCHLSTIPNAPLDDLVARLELELSKIQAFKSQLPLCMLLLNDAISALKVETEKCRAHKKSENEEKKDHESKKEEECRDKKNWMSSVQLWNTTSSNNNNNNSYSYDSKRNHKLGIKKNEEERKYVAEDLFRYDSNINGGRDFVMPFSTYFATKEEKEDAFINGFSFKTPESTVMRNTSEGSNSYGSRASFGRVVPSSSHLKTCQKQRRSWSPELHRRFVEALEELGGSQVATPKQIRSLMKVNGLTNDEVKSHLQKYRLHIRRVLPASAANSNQSVVIHRGLWMYNGSGSRGHSQPNLSYS